MKGRVRSRLFLPVTLLLLAVLVACQQTDDSTSSPAAPSTIPALVAPPAREFSAADRAAISEFAEKYDAVEQEWSTLRTDFDGWRSALTECHPSAAQAALGDFAASFREVTDAARDLPRTISTKELADLIIPAVEAEEAAFRNLRDRWQPGNTSFFESLEQRRTEASTARKAVEDRSLELQEQFEAGPTRVEVVEAELFQEQFEDIEDAWEDYHRDYRQLRRMEAGLESEELIDGYDELTETLSAVLDSLTELEATDITEDLLDVLQDAAEDELDAVVAVAEFVSEGDEADSAEPENVMMESPAAPVAAQAAGEDGVPTAPPVQTGEGAPPATLPGGPTQPTQGGAPSGPSPQAGTGGVPAPQGAMTAGPAPATAGSPASGAGTGTVHDELDYAYSVSVKALEEASQGLEDIIEDKSAEYLADVKDFNRDYDSLLTEWASFHEGYDGWLESDGDCDRLAALRVLEGYSSRANELAGRVRDLPRTGYLLPVYTLLVDAAEREDGAMRALYSSWRPFAIDAFAAVDEERTIADRLRQQAGTGLQELSTRP